ncbi:MAG: DUF3943 domain-containing protein [Muribaculaceae bacterium]
MKDIKNFRLITLISLFACIQFCAIGRDTKCDSITQQNIIANNTANIKIPKNIYSHEYSFSEYDPDWHRLWINTATLGTAYVGTLLVLECLPEDATSWNRAELRDVPLFERWHDHVIKRGPEWDHDNFIFNYILHPYAGAVYYMAARSCGFNAWRSVLYCSIVSTIGWEFGIEAFMERPSIQDLFITPIVGSFIGECFYKIKRNIVANNYTLCGSKCLGNIVAYLIDPINEVMGLIIKDHCPERNHASCHSGFSLTNSGFAYSLTINF